MCDPGPSTRGPARFMGSRLQIHRCGDHPAGLSCRVDTTGVPKRPRRRLHATPCLGLRCPLVGVSPRPKNPRASHLNGVGIGVKLSVTRVISSPGNLGPWNHKASARSVEGLCTAPKCPTTSSTVDRPPYQSSPNFRLPEAANPHSQNTQYDANRTRQVCGLWR